MAVFIVLWPHLLTTKLRCLQKNNIGHTRLYIAPILWWFLWRPWKPFYCNIFETKGIVKSSIICTIIVIYFRYGYVPLHKVNQFRFVAHTGSGVFGVLATYSLCKLLWKITTNEHGIPQVYTCKWSYLKSQNILSCRCV